MVGGLVSFARHAWRLRLLRIAVPAAAGSLLLGAALLGDARPSAAAEGQNFTISGDAPGLLYPGSGAVSINLTFSNPNDDGMAVSGLTVSIASVTAPNATASLPCTTANYTVTQFGGFFPLLIPPGSSSLSSLAFASSTWPTVQELETNQDQTGCAGATVHLSYGAAGQDGPAATGSVTTKGSTAPFVPPAKGLSLALVPVKKSIAAGGKAMFGVTVGNTSGLELTGVKVQDSIVPNCAHTVGTMKVGAALTYSCTLSKAQKTFVNKATASGKTSSGSTVTASASAKVEVAALTPPQHPAIAIRMTPATQTLTTQVAHRKVADATRVSLTYASAHFKLEVTNTGQVGLAVTVGDALAPGCDRSFAKLAPGASRSYSCVRKAVTAGFTNVAVATGKDSKGAKATARSHVKIKVKTSTGATVTKTSSGVTVTKSKSGKTVTLSVPDVLFAFNESTLGPNATRPLMTVLKLVTVAYKTGRLTVTGYTDGIGSVAYNLDLSKRRAATVATWLEQHGVPAGRVAIAWKGEADPIASNATAQGRHENRRVTVTVRAGT